MTSHNNYGKFNEKKKNVQDIYNQRDKGGNYKSDVRATPFNKFFFFFLNNDGPPCKFLFPGVYAVVKGLKIYLEVVSANDKQILMILSIKGT